MMRFVLPYSHAFRGGRLEVVDDVREGESALVEFGDGVTVIAEWRRVGDSIELRIPAYRTAKGNEVISRNWIVAQGKDGVWRSQPAARMPADDR